MGRILIFLVFIVSVVLVVPQGSQAGIPIPCADDHLVLVKDLPEAVQIQTKRGPVHIDLGYKFSGCTDGKWVGYAEDGTTYYDLPQTTLSLYAFRAGLNGLPPAPSYLFTLSASWPVWVWGVASLLGGMGAWCRLRRRIGPPPAVSPASEATVYPPLLSAAQMSKEVAVRKSRPPFWARG